MVAFDPDSYWSDDSVRRIARSSAEQIKVHTIDTCLTIASTT
jgi:hypothetical protein